ncbi:MAG: ABC transporter permease [Nitrososphaerota archaeon]|nr:ABC transporter permease [Nitrososphaerota archaeon]
MTLSKRLKDVLLIIGGIAILLSTLVFWQIVSITNLLPSTIFPSAKTVVYSFFQQVLSGTVFLPILETLSRLFEGFLLAALIGVLGGIGIGVNSLADETADPLVQFLRPMPSVVLIPLAMLYFGLTSFIVIILVAYASVWPILINTSDGVKSIDPVLLDTARQFHVNGFDRFRKIVLPAASPFILSGLRVSLGIAWIVAITVEMISGVVRNGVGVTIFFYLNSGNLGPMYGAIIAVALTAYVLNYLFTLLQSKLTPWFERSTKVVQNEV